MPLIGLRAFFLAALLAGILPLGSVRPINLYLSGAGQTLLFCVVLSLTPVQAIPRRPVSVLLGVVGSAAIYLVAQATWFSGNPLANAVWAQVAGELGLEGGSISVAPADTLRSLPSLLAPFFVFGTALLLSGSDLEGYRTWRGLTLMGLAIALFGLLRLYAFPATRLFSQDHLSTGAMTAVFVNQNNAATFLGLTALAMLGLLFWQLRQIDREQLVQDLRRPSSAGLRRQLSLLLSGLALLLIVVALFLTRSRAGIAFSSAALMGALLAFVATLPYRAATARRKAVGMAIAIVSGLVAVATLGERTILRTEVAGYDGTRSCLYRDVLAAIGENPWFGTGFGTFERIYPMVRSAACGLYGNPERAHSSYLEAYLGLGLPFVALLAVCLACLLSIYATGLRERRTLRFIPILSLAALALMLGHSAVDFPIQIHGVAIYFAALLGCGAGVSLARSKA